MENVYWLNKIVQGTVLEGYVKAVQVDTYSTPANATQTIASAYLQQMKPVSPAHHSSLMKQDYVQIRFNPTV